MQRHVAVDGGHDTRLELEIVDAITVVIAGVEDRLAGGRWVGRGAQRGHHALSGAPIAFDGVSVVARLTDLLEAVAAAVLLEDSRAPRCDITLRGRAELDRLAERVIGQVNHAVRVLVAHIDRAGHVIILSGRLTEDAAGLYVAALQPVAPGAIVAHDRITGNALPSCANVAYRAGVFVVTRELVGREDAAVLGVAHVGRARIPIGARELLAAQARTLRAVVADGARVTVLAQRLVVVLVEAAGGRVTAVVSTRARVVAVQRGVRNALPLGAMVTERAGVAVAAWAVVRRVLTEPPGCTRVLGTGVLVVTGLFDPSGAYAGDAHVAHSAGVIVRAGALDRFMFAPPARKAGVERTNVAIIAGERAASHAAPLGALISERAGVVVVAGALIGRKGAASQRITSVVSAWISVITGERDGPRLTRSLSALIAHSAQIPIITWRRVRSALAAIARIARVVGTRVSIVTWEDPPGHASAPLALVIDGAAVLVITRRFVGEEHAADAHDTGVVRARVPVVTGQARRATNAGRVLAVISERARVTVVARLLVRSAHAARRGLTQVGRTGVLVVTVDRRAGQAGALRATVAGRAGVVVVAGAAHGDKEASGHLVAAVLSARVAVVTQQGRA